MRVAMLAAAAALVLASAAAPADEQAGPSSSSPTSQPDAAALARLAKTPDNSWLDLKPEGMAKARMYSGCAFGGGYLWYFGGAHRGYKGNDVQLYDPTTNVWIQATEPEWPEIGSEDWKLMTGGGGTTKHLSPTGRPFTEHTYQQVCWQPDRKRFFVVLMSSGTWEFDPAGRKWIHLISKFKNDKPEPRGTWAQNLVVYDPGLAAPVMVLTSGDNSVYRFDHAKAEWVRLAETPQGIRWNETYSTWVPEWNAHLMSGAKKGFYKFELPGCKVTPIEAPEALKGCQSLAYDCANRVVIALARAKVSDREQTVQPWALNVATMKWTELNPPKPWPQGQCTANWGKLWYDAAHNVHLFVNDVRRDRAEVFDGGVTETWAYRYATPRSAQKTAPNGKPEAGEG